MQAFSTQNICFPNFAFVKATKYRCAKNQFPVAAAPELSSNVKPWQYSYWQYWQHADRQPNNTCAIRKCCLADYSVVLRIWHGYNRTVILREMCVQIAVWSFLHIRNTPILQFSPYLTVCPNYYSKLCHSTSLIVYTASWSLVTPSD